MSKRGNSKTLEELLKEALVPEEEQPYEIPENWVWAKIESINTASSPNIEPNKFQNEEFILYSVPSFELGSPEIILGSEIKSNKQLVSTGDVLISKINPRINRVWTVGKHENYRVLASTEWIVIKSNYVLSKYLEYYFKSPYFRNILCSNVSGVGGSLTRARPKEVMKYSVPIAPLKEQLIILQKTESLISKIDEAKQMIDEAKETFELRRLSIIDNCIKGHYSNSPKKYLNSINNSKLSNAMWDCYFQEVPESWELVTIQSVCTDSFYGPRFGKNEYSTDGIPTLRTTDMTNDGSIVLKGDTPKITLSEKDFEKYKVKQGDLLVTRTGSIGKMAVFKGDFPAIPSAYLIRFRFNDKVDTDYMFYYLNSLVGQSLLGLNTTTTTQPNINAQTIKTLPLLLPPIDEQRRIVEIVHSSLELELKSLSEIKAVESTLEKIRMGVLSKAFKGKLGSNDPKYEPAIELLKEVLQEQLK